jgi:hypothetical protein
VTKLKSKRWSVYRILRKGAKREAISLGYVNASHQPGALLAAWRKWPKECDSNQVQNGFSVVPYADDFMALGKRNRARNAAL